MALFINDEQQALKLDAKKWQRTAEKIAAQLGVEADAEWSLTFVTDEAIRQFNREYRGYDKPTDVLSFGQLEGEDFPMPDEQALVLGDVVIAVPTAMRQAEERGHSVDAELALLITHGLLHLLGEDHDTPERKAVMWERQQAVLDALGFEVKDFGDS